MRKQRPSDAAKPAEVEGKPEAESLPSQQRPSQQRPSQQRPSQQRPSQQRPSQQRPNKQSAEGEYVLLPPPAQGGRKLLAIGGISLLVLGIMLGSLLLWASRKISPSGEQGQVISSLVVPSGATTASISGLLASNKVISDARMFTYYAGWKNAGPWNAGDYVEFRTNSSFDQAIAVLDEGPVPVQAKVVRVTEGMRLEDALVAIADQMGTVSAEQLQTTLDSGNVISAYKPEDVTSWEGLLFPDTYEFEESATPQVILQTMATQMEKILDGLGYDKAQALQGRSAYELVTIASLIEKETGAPIDERGKIARVINNRLDDSETLGIDASVLYGLGRASGSLSKSDLASPSPYNTRKVKGLPPTPIALPGKASLEAAIEPPAGTWRYYVLTSNDPPEHLFTDSYNEFLRAKDDAQARGVF
ncbi:MAG: endolytic transglycosylase MltG [Microthrixaceae bacterium]